MIEKQEFNLIISVREYIKTMCKQNHFEIKHKETYIKQ